LRAPDNREAGDRLPGLAHVDVLDDVYFLGAVVLPDFEVSVVPLLDEDELPVALGDELPLALLPDEGIELPLAPLPVDGDALPDVVDPPVLLVLAPSTPSDCIVFASSWPVACMPCAFWKSRSACFVLGPILPSIVPGSWPLSFKACCAAFTFSSPAIAMLSVRSRDAFAPESDFIDGSDFIVVSALIDPVDVVESFGCAAFVSAPVAVLPVVGCAKAGPANITLMSASAIVIFHGAM
jgi:hypothetical protein